jgi:hypothetical protein
MSRVYVLTEPEYKFACYVACSPDYGWKNNAKNVPLQFWFVRPELWPLMRAHREDALPRNMHQWVLTDLIEKFYNQLPKPMEYDYGIIYKILLDVKHLEIRNVRILSADGKLLLSSASEKL